MAKVRNLTQIEKTLAFTEYDFYELYQKAFETHELGRIKRLLPLREMAEKMGLIRTDPKKKSLRVKRGRKSFFSPEGKVALVYLKMYTGLSGPKLMEELNGNIFMQIFCGVRIDPSDPLTNYRLIDAVVLEVSDHLRIVEQQEVLAKAWKPYMRDLDTMYTDATCYESRMRYPTDVKLLWECVERAYSTMCSISSRLGEKRMRTKYQEVAQSTLTYRKQRKHKKGQTRHMTMRLLKLLGKILGEIGRQMREHGDKDIISEKEMKMVDVITKVYRQQKSHFESGDARESIPERIVSLSKPYVRPIVRGKETKSVEFGAKCNNIMVDGLSFIENLSFNPFNEGTRLKECLALHKSLFGTEVKKVGGDQGYAGNENRTLCRELGIETSFVPKGKHPKDNAKSLVRKELARVRATAMEGSFGTQKEHYGLNRYDARLKKTEIMAIFFGIHTANVVQLARRLEGEQRQTADAA